MPETKTIRVECRWRSVQTVDVPGDYIWTGAADDEWIDQVDTSGAELVDWSLA